MRGVPGVRSRSSRTHEFGPRWPRVGVPARRQPSLPCAHLGSIGLSHGLFTGRKHATIRTPPSARAFLLWDLIQTRTRLLTCHAALSHTKSSAFFPSSPNRLHPRQVVLGYLRNRATGHEPQHHPARVRTQPPVARPRLGVRITLRHLALDQPQRAVVRPGVHRRQRQPTPPALVLIPQHPLPVRRRQPDQAVPRFFFARAPGRGW
ncbi:hypothetical protein VT84_22140 [Gemmata sp. SH-PL17]|nr:hypothetical protein VT84_22140 [Gemmata sp. SH-PL17]